MIGTFRPYNSEQAVLHTSWTDKNLGRRFFGCPYWYPGALKTGGAHCDYFDWLDGPIGEQEKVVLRSQRDIGSVKQRILEYETKMEEIEIKCKEQEEKCKEYGRKIEKYEKKNKKYRRRIEEYEKKNKKLEANVRKSNVLMWAVWVACSILVVILLAIMGTHSRPETKYLRLPHSRSG